MQELPADGMRLKLLDDSGLGDRAAVLDAQREYGPPDVALLNHLFEVSDIHR